MLFYVKIHEVSVNAKIREMTYTNTKYTQHATLLLCVCVSQARNSGLCSDTSVIWARPLYTKHH